MLCLMETGKCGYDELNLNLDNFTINRRKQTITSQTYRQKTVGMWYEVEHTVNQVCVCVCVCVCACAREFSLRQRST
jgi:hypothetical protein